MADTRKIIKVFLASPGDLSDERRAAKAVVDEFNKLWADTLGYHVELVGWEDTVSRYGRPQELINQDKSERQIAKLLGISRSRFWKGRLLIAIPKGLLERFEAAPRRHQGNALHLPDRL
jgi:hypothetical protein